MLDLVAFLIAVAGQVPVSPAPAPQRSPDVAPLNAPLDSRIAAEVAHIFPQVYPHWRLRCDDPGFVRQRIQFDVTLDAEGRIVSGPTAVRPRDDAAWRAAAEGARSALIAAAPYDVPEGFGGGQYRPTFSPARACAAD